MVVMSVQRVNPIDFQSFESGRNRRPGGKILIFASSENIPIGTSILGCIRNGRYCGRDTSGEVRMSFYAKKGDEGEAESSRIRWVIRFYNVFVLARSLNTAANRLFYG